MSHDPDAPPEDPLVGQVIQERFRIDQKLGQGGMGAIYLAEHLLLKKKVAIKCLHAGLASNPDVVRRFKNEAVAATSIGHPNIVDVMDMGRFADGTFFMVLEFLEGRDWQEDLDEEGAQPVTKVAHIGAQVCGALGAAAKKGIVHRDLKPENIFLISRQGDACFVKVLDFGISKILDGSGGATKTGELMGTPYYMAPEQVLGEKEINHLADVYALGVIFFQALSGTVPFEGDTLAQIIMKIATAPTPALRERAPKVPAALADLVGQMMAKEPSARPQTFAEVAARLAPHCEKTSPFYSASAPTPAALQQTMLPGSVPQAFGVTAQSTAEAGSKLRSLPKPALAAAAVLGVLLIGWMLVGGDDAEAEAEALGPSDVGVTVEEETEEEQEEQAAEEEGLVRVQISTVPKDAQLFLDGKALENPFDEKLPQDEESHELVVKRSGYRTETRKMVLTAPQSIVIPLSEGSDPVAKPATKPKVQKSGATSSSGSSPQPSPSPSSGSSRSHTPPKPIRDIERGLKKLF